MASDKKVVTLEEHEQRLMVRGLADYRNDAIRDGKPTDDIDDLLLKVIDAPPKRKRGCGGMKQDKFSPVSLICYACGCIPVIWIALLFAPYLDDGLIGLIKNAGAAFANPFHIMLCRDSLRAVLIFLLIYGLALAVFLSSDRNYRRREEHGSAQWGSPKEISRKYANKAAPENKILTQTVAIGLDGRKHRRNLNILCCGGSGAGKTRFLQNPM